MAQFDITLHEQRELMLSVKPTLPKFRKLAIAKRTPAIIQRRLDELQRTLGQLRGNDAKLCTQAVDSQLQNAYFIELQFRQIMEVFDDTVTFLEDALVSSSSSSNTTRGQEEPAQAAQVMHHAQVSHAPLPKFKLPTFAGNLNDWEEFRDRFTSIIINDKRLSDSDRMKYLCTSLDGSARRAIAHLRITDANFRDAWELVCHKFQNIREMIASRFDALHAISSVSAHSLPNLQTLYELVQSTPRSVKSLGRNVDGWGDLYVDCVIRKLDKDARMLLADRLPNDRDPITLEQLDAFLEHRIQVLQSGKRTMSMNKPSVPARSHQPSAAKLNLNTIAKALQCPLCSASHVLYKCFKFLKLSVEKRTTFVQDKRLCSLCLLDGHSTSKCTSSYRCRFCQAAHSSLLHARAPLSPTDADPQPSVPVISDGKVVSHTAMSLNNGIGPVLLATAVIRIYNPDGRSAVIRALVDQGSEVTLVSERIAQLLQLSRVKHITKISGVGEINCISKHSATIGISNRLSEKAFQFTNALIVHSLTQARPLRANPLRQWKYLHGLALADPNLTDAQSIDCIIGVDLYGCIIRNGIRRGGPSDPVAQNSVLGWILSGKYKTDRDTSEVSVNTSILEKLDCDLQKFWFTEELPQEPVRSAEEQQCESYFQTTVSRTADGRYVVRLPFRSGFSGELGDSYTPALQCLKALEQRLGRDADRYEAYRQFMAEYEQLGHMSLRPANSPVSRSSVYYIPHHAVFRTVQNETKIRVVFNASKPTRQGRSLNDSLLIGPKLQLDISAIILSWRNYRFVLTADITKMYRQILVDSRDRNYQRILWRRSPDDPIREYLLNTVTYGTAPAPYLAIRVLRQLAVDEGDAFPQAREIILTSSYVDDHPFGGDTIAEALDKRNQLISLMAKGKFSLSKWSANDDLLLKDIDSIDEKITEKNFASSEDLHILGIKWNPSSDTFHYKVSTSIIESPTKRLILSNVAKLFDPLGWISPVISYAKIFIQKLWLINCTWDELLPCDLHVEWTKFYEQLPLLQRLSIPRWTGLCPEVGDLQLHGFCDASSKAYAAVVYLRLVTSQSIRTVLLMSKSRVAPVKTLTIPRLELCTAVLLAKLIDFIRTSCSDFRVPQFCWSDSTVVLEWIKHPPNKYKVFVAHRVSKIQTLLPSATWNHIDSSSNPADHASRGLTPETFLLCTTWWNGPEWLCQSCDHWPLNVTWSVPPAIDLEENSHVLVAQQQVIEPWNLSTRFSSWFKLLRVTAYVYRFVKPICRRSGLHDQALSVTEINRSKVFWLRQIQHELFSKEISEIKTNAITSSNSLISLSPFIDNNGLIRVRGRLANAAMPNREKFPIVLGSHPLVKGLISDLHKLLLHCGPALLLTTLRKEFWILRSRQLVRSVLYSCVLCTRHRARTENQRMADLPQFRVTPSSRAFVHVGIDYAGPIWVRSSPGRGYKSRKAYIFGLLRDGIYGSVTAIYISPRYPTDVYSDNGTNFVGANRELKEIRRAAQNIDVRNVWATHGITWHFIPPSAPHFGGLWEVSVRGVKRYLTKTIGSHKLTYEELNTVLCRIEACINSRPLMPFSDNIDDYSVLTPGHFLIGGPLVALPEPSTLEIKENRLSRWQLLQRMSETFWTSWHKDYLNTLLQRSKWHKRNLEIYPGRLVLIKTDGLPPSRWSLGRVSECIPGNDGLIRVAVIKNSTTTLRRPITKLCLLPGDINQLDGQS